jgi:hypothetical protein
MSKQRTTSLLPAEAALIAELEAAGWRFADWKLSSAKELDTAHFAGTQDLIKSRSWAALRALNAARNGEPIPPPPPQRWAHCIGGHEIFLEYPFDDFEPYLISIIERGEDYWIEETHQPRRGMGWEEVAPKVFRRRRTVPGGAS